MTTPQVLDSQQQFAGRVITLRTDTVAMPDGSTVQRDVVEHPGAVGVVAIDAHGYVALLEQYRHPVASRLWELPAGLLDVAGEPARDAAARELMEEAGLEAEDWSVLVDTLSSPGMTDEAIRIFLARGLREVPRPLGRAEEADLTLAWVLLEEAVDRVLSGEIRNAMACVGVLAAARVLDGPTPPRAPDAPWPDRVPAERS
jgi:8-oxo-dGTP pyrophosphatase MutT (NUDIX family)